MRYYQGNYKPRNPKKYAGNPQNIIYRSSYELRLFQYLDDHPDVTEWASEELAIPYISPVDKRPHRYFVDVLFKNRKGDITMVEIKPAIETKPPVLAEGKRSSDRRYKKQIITYAVNQAKWKAARAFCAERGWQFVIMTEKELFGK